ncbi:MAG TPA: protease pro-enzyme activation domain-containing protein [Terriglobales bacterium]|jgi:subtilase family serine protease|nr:protease pro-enzyme activation domain-containing protein [Terriglobales bacterium]
MRKHSLPQLTLAALVCAAAFLLFAIPGLAQQPLQVLHNHVRPAVASGQAAPVGLLPPTQRLNLAITLPLRNQSDLSGLLSRINDASSPDYRHFLSVAQFTEQFSPTVQDYQTVVNFAKANGFTVTDIPPNRLLVDINGTVAQIEKAFHVTMKVYQHPTENRTFYSPDREPSLDLSVPVTHIAGLNDFSLPHSKLKKAPGGQAFHGNAGGSGPGGAFLGGDMRAAYYGGTALTGTGQSVGLCEFDGYNMSDVTSTFDGVSYNVPINNVLIDGANGGSDGDDGEQVLDIVQAIAMAPGMSQVRVYIAPGTTSIGVGDKDMFNKMATDNISKELSCSWGWNPDDTTDDDPIFQEFAAQGQNMFVASGDAGAYTGNNATDESYPAESVYVVAVGGTDLTTNGAGGSWASETAWADSSGGPADNGFAIPSWQVGVANSSNQASTTIRNLPDVAAEGNFDNYLCDQGSCAGDWGGTSFAAPRWAGFLALTNQQVVANGNSTLGFLNPIIYPIAEGSNYTSDFHDITSGNNNNGKGKSYNAVTGYDLVTGWGSPNGQNLINALAGSESPSFTLSDSPSSLTITQGGAGGTSTITVNDLGGFTGSVTLTASGLPSGVTAVFNPNPTSTTSILTLTASGSATTGTFTVTITGTSGSLMATTTLSLTVNPAGTPNFTISASPSSLTIKQGSNGTSTITITSQNGFNSATSLTATGLPSGVTAAFSPNPVTPPANSSATSTLTLTAAANATVGTATVTVTGTSGSLSHSTNISLTVSSSSGAQTAVYSSTLKAPECSAVGISCDSGPSLLLGRDHISGGAEPNQPNTINNSCADGTTGTFHSDESNDRIVVASTSGNALTHGTTATVTATVWAYSAYNTDALDLYYAANANSPSWVFIKTIVPTKAGAQSLSATFTLPTGALQAVRAQFRYQGRASSCTTGAYNDHDDLIFAVQ